MPFRASSAGRACSCKHVFSCRPNPGTTVCCGHTHTHTRSLSLSRSLVLALSEDTPTHTHSQSLTPHTHTHTSRWYGRLDMCVSHSRMLAYDQCLARVSSRTLNLSLAYARVCLRMLAYALNIELYIYIYI
jgi:hypothetical protein